MNTESPIANFVATKEPQIVPLVDILPLLQKEATTKRLNVFVFTNEEVNKFFTTKTKDFGIALLAKDIDSATWNLKNLRRCYLVKINEEDFKEEKDIDSISVCDKSEHLD